MTASSRPPTPESIQQKIAAGEFRAALTDTEQLLEQDPGCSDALYMAAVCHRYTAQYEQAQQCLTRLKSGSADRGRVYQEQGHLDMARQRPEQALAAYANACQLNPALVASWRSQSRILEAMGKLEEARQAQAQVKRLEALPRTLVAVTDTPILLGGDFNDIWENLCRKFLRAHPTHVEGMRLLAEIAIQFGVLEDAEYLLESAAEFEPGNTQVQMDLVGILRKRQKFAQALGLAETLYQEHPQNPQLASLYAIEKMQMGDYAGAIALFDRVLQSLPGDPVTLTSRGHALKTHGQQQQAIASYKAAIASNPWHGDAYYALSNLKTYRFSTAEIQQMLAMERDDDRLAPP